MKRLRIILTVLILITPAVAWGNVPEPRLDIRLLDPSSAFSILHLSDNKLTLPHSQRGRHLIVLPAYRGSEARPDNKRARDETSSRQVITSNRSRVTMLSYLCGNLVTGVDVVAELKAIRKSFRIRGPGRSAGKVRTGRTGSGWRVELGFLPVDDMEITARIGNKGNRLTENDYTFGLNTVADDVGVRTAYHRGELDVRVGNVHLGNDLSARLMISF